MKRRLRNKTSSNSVTSEKSVTKKDSKNSRTCWDSNKERSEKEANCYQITQSTINSLREILNPQIKIVQAKQFVEFYSKQYENRRASDKDVSENHSCILDYSFMNSTSKRKKNIIETTKPLSRKSFYSRQVEKMKQKEDKIKEMRNNKEEKLRKTLRDRPLINEKSRRLADKARKSKKTTARSANTSTDAALTAKSSTSRQDKERRNMELALWLTVNETREKIKQAKINYLKNELEEEKKLNEKLEEKEFTFNPKINKNSIKIINKKRMSVDIICENPSAGERLYKDHERKERELDLKRKFSLPTFCPKINKKYVIGNTYYNYMKENQREIFENLCF